jgi:hypothetical protein
LRRFPAFGLWSGPFVTTAELVRKGKKYAGRTGCEHCGAFGDIDDFETWMMALKDRV